MTTQTSMVMTRIGGRDYPMRSVGNCKTCQSPHRAHIENLLIKGLSYTAIAAEVSSFTEAGRLGHPSIASITDHAKKQHMPVGPAAQRALIERRAHEIGLDADTAVEGLVDQVTVARMIVHKGFEMLQEGEISPDVKDVMAASKFLFEVDRQQPDGGLDQATFMAVLHAYMETAQQFISQEMWGAYAKALQSNPVLRAVAAQMEADARAARGLIEG